MKQKQFWKKLMAILCIFLLICSFFSILHFSSHDCAGTNCAICALIQFIKGVFSVILLGVVSLIGVDSVSKSRNISAQIFTIKNGTPILQKVKLSD